ncbi:11 kDa protein [Cole latent virus]|uniref:RNA silencing suppressor n=1 Tax=Cole latent virus TaxID=241525 RepID=Q7T5V9_9VIRU|nr:11 kDa protein [Cole latent virus]AAQ19968.1 11 kDa protein [Cole latent virus]
MKYVCEVAIIMARYMEANFGVFEFNIAYSIASKCDLPINRGRSTYARKRRAAFLGRCHRCYRVWPPISYSRCDNKTCVPGMSYNERVARFIVDGVTEVIPRRNNRNKLVLNPI